MKILFSDLLLSEKANRATNALLLYLEQNAKEEIIVWAKNIKILYKLQSLFAKVLEVTIKISSSLY